MEKIKNVASAARGRLALLGAVTGLMLMTGLVAAGGANASTTTDPVSDGISQMQDKVTTYGAAVVGLVVAVVILFFGIKFLKKGASKA